VPISCQCPSCGKRLKAPDSAAGKKAKCPQCGKPVKIPEQEVYEAEVADSDDEFGLQNFNAEDAVAGPAEDDRRPCPMCGEMILTTAAKCRYCGEVFDETLKRTEKKKKSSRGAATGDEDLTTGDWIFCILCGGIACIFGIVYAIQGKPKGLKMVGVALAAQFFWAAVRVILEFALKQQ